MERFPKIPNIIEKNCVVGEDFHVMKKNSVEKYNTHNVFNFTNDRFIPSKNVNSNCLKASKKDDMDIVASENNLKSMKKIHYQNTLKLIYYEQRAENRDERKSRQDQRNVSLHHFDWACKLINIREKFLPDFETLEKKSFHRIHNYTWSSKNIIAASSSKKVCLYHPTNGFTRALDVYDNVTIAFSHNGDLLAMAYRKSRREPQQSDLYIFQIDNEALFNSDRLNTEKTRSFIESDITAMCFSTNDNYLLCGTDSGLIYVLKAPVKTKVKSDRHNWQYLKTLSESHRNEVIKICFSATARYMATLDAYGEFKIWNGTSWTYIFSYQHEQSRLYKFFEWHPYTENELIIGRQHFPALYLFNVTERQIVASYTKWKEDWELTSIAYNPVSAQLAVCFYNHEEYINRVCLLASMSQVITSFDFDYIEGGMKLFWNNNGLMLGAGAQFFRFAFWSFYKNHDFQVQMAKDSNKKNSKKLPALSDLKLQNIR